MNRAQAETFVQEWIAAWNRTDVESIAAHYAEDCVFVSPRAAALTGNPTVQGRVALLSYWVKGRAAAGSFDFRLEDFAWDDARRVLVIRYVNAKRGSGPIRAVEIMRFGRDGKVASGEALYGAEA